MRYYFIIFLVAVFFRFAYLDLIPNAISGDELHYITTAKFITITGRDITGTWNPLSLLWFRYPPSEHQAELPYIIHYIFAARAPFSLFIIKLPFALLSIGIVLLLADIARILFGKAAGIATGFIAAINPWIIIMGRTGYEATPAMFFYLLAFWMLLRQKGKTILLSIIPLCLAFYSYIGTKILIAPIAIGISYIAYLKNDRRFTRYYGSVIAITIGIALGFFYLTKIDPSGSRLGEILLPNAESIAHDVNAMRKTTIANPMTSLLINKYTIYTEVIINKFLRILSPTYLFVEGDQFFLPVRQGFFYYVDVVFLLIGALAIYAKKRAYALPLWALVAATTIPQLISTTQGDFSIHLTMLFPILILFIGAGLAWVCRWPIITIICIGIYSINVAGFAQTYFYRSPLVGYADFPKRVLTRYATLAEARGLPIVVYVSSTQEYFQKYLLYANAIEPNTVAQLKTIGSPDAITFKNMRILPCQSSNKISPGQTIIVDALCGSKTSDHHQSITTLTDGGENYIIQEDKLCNTYSLKRYPQDITLPSLAIERLSEKEFCETFISQR